MTTIEEHRANVIKFININDINALNNYIKVKNINLNEINDKNFDLLIFAIEKYASLSIIEFIIRHCQYETLNYIFNINNGYEQYNTDAFAQDIHFVGLKIPLFSSIICKNFEIANLLIKYKANINFGIDIKNYGTVDIISYLCNISNYNYYFKFDTEILQYILNHGFNIKKITNDLLYKLVFLIQKFENEFINIIFKHYIFDNIFIIQMLNFRKNNNSLSDKQLQEIINKERNKLEINEMLYQIATSEGNFDAIKLLLDFDSSNQNIILERIKKYKILEKAVNTYNFNLVKKILKFCDVSDMLTITIEDILINECKNGNTEKIKWFIKHLNFNITTKINFEKILREISIFYNYCYDKPVMKFIVDLLLNTIFKEPGQFNIDKIKYFNASFLNLLLNVLIENQNLKIIKDFLKSNELKNYININVKDISGTYPLIVAVRTINISIFHLLINHGANCNIKDNENNSLLSIAILNHNYLVINYLLLKYSIGIYDISKDLPIMNNIHNNSKNQNQLKTIENRLYYNENINEYFTPLIYSYILENQIDFEYLLNTSDINELDSFGNNILYYAIIKEDIKIVKYLISNRIYLDFSNNRIEKYYHSVLDISIYIKNKDIINIILESNNSLLNIPNGLGEVPLITLIKYKEITVENKIEFIKEFIKKGANVNFISGHGYSPIVYAIQEKLIDLVKLFIESGADVNLLDKYEDTPLVYAIKENDLPLVKLLIDNGANVNYRDSNGYTPLCYAVQNENVEITKLLIEYKANVNICHPNDHSPFEYTLYSSNSLSMVQLLMENDINLNVQVNLPIVGGKISVLMYAFNKGNFIYNMIYMYILCIIIKKK